MKKLLLILSLFTLLPGLLLAQDGEEEDVVSYTASTEYVIGGIEVTGLKTVDKGIIVAISGLVVGEEVAIPGDDISNAIKKLWKQKLFTDVQIVATKYIGGNVFLEIRVVERPRLSRFKILGVKKGEFDDLKSKVDLKVSSIVTEANKINTVNEIKEYFDEKGFKNVKVNIIEEPDTSFQDRVMITIYVDKGDKVKVDNIYVVGNSAASDKKIKGQMKNTNEKVKLDLGEILKFEKNWKDTADFSVWKALGNLSYSKADEYLDDHINLNIFKSSRFIEEDFNSDKQAIIAYYNNLGYRDARIAWDTTYQTDSKNMDVVIAIEEGNKYYFRNIYWKGNSIHSDSTLDYRLRIDKGDVYNQAYLDSRLNFSPAGDDVSALYMDNGYLFFSVTPVEVMVEGDSIDLEMRVYEGTQAIINNIIITGNTKTNDYVIRRELRVIPGNIFSREDLIRSQREIAALGYFDPEQIEVIPYPNPTDGTVDIEFRVVEKPSDQLELSAGWGGAGRGIFGTLGLSFTNFSLKNMFKKGAWSPLPAGDGQTLSIRMQSNGKAYQAYNFAFTEPWLGGKKPNSLSVSFYRTRFNDLDIENNVEGKLITTGTTVALGTRLKWPDDFFVFQPSLIYQQYNLDNWNGSNFTFSDGKSNVLAAKFVLSRSSAGPNPIYPTGGSNFSLSFEATLPYSKLFPGRKNLDYTDPELPDAERFKWIEYHKWRFNAEWFQAVSKNGKLVFRASAKLGFLGTYNEELGLSPFERFELGGDGLSNVQFFGREIISLRGYDVITPSAGSPIFNKFTMELRYPISLNPSATVYGLAFLEGGNYWNSVKEYNPVDLKRSVGAGLRVYLPMFGLLGFDYGIGFDDTPAQGNNIFSQYGEFKLILGFEPE